MVALNESISEPGLRREARGYAVTATYPQGGNGIPAGEINYPGAAAHMRPAAATGRIRISLWRAGRLPWWTSRASDGRSHATARPRPRRWPVSSIRIKRGTPSNTTSRRGIWVARLMVQPCHWTQRIISRSRTSSGGLRRMVEIIRGFLPRNCNNL